jgi:excisionase family DNA binding protein
MPSAISAVQLNKLVYAVKEVADILGLSTDTVYEMVRCGSLPHIRIGRRILIPRVMLEKWLSTPHEWGSFNG